MTHEIRQGGKSYFLEWDKEAGRIAITECLPEGCVCDSDSLDCEHEPLETYDFKEVVQ